MQNNNNFFPILLGTLLLWVSLLFMSMNKQVETISISPVKTDMFLQQYGEITILNYQGEKLPCKVVPSAAKEWLNYTNNLNQMWYLDTVYLNNVPYLACTAEDILEHEVLISPLESHGMYISESEFPIVKDIGMPKGLPITLKADNFTVPFAEDEITGSLVKTNKPGKYKVYFKHCNQIYSTFIIRT